jgi:PAS domain S-box-containing protein
MPLWHHLLFFILLVFGASIGQVCAQTQPQIPLKEKNVLILNALESSVPGFEKTNQGLSAALQSGGIGVRNQFYEHLDLRRNPSPEHKKLVLELLHQRYDQRKIDFIITLYTDALKLLLDEAQAVLPEAPVLALYLPQGYELPDTRRRIIPHSVVPDLKRTLEIALKMVPTAERVYVVSGVHPLDRWFEDKARRDFRQWEDRLEFRYLSDLPLEKILDASAGAPSDSIIFITNFSTDVSGKPLTTMEVGRRLTRVSKAPVFGCIDTLLGNGIVGGSLISLEYVGTKAGEMALDFLSRAQYTGNVPTVLEVAQVDAFDWRQLRHWNLKESTLPRGSKVINKGYTLWDFRYYVIGALAFVLAQSLLIAGLLIHRRRRRSAEGLLNKRLEFESLLSEISARFVNLPADRIDSEIEEAQRRVCEHLGLDMSVLWQASLDNPLLMSLSHVYRPLGGPPLPEPMDAQEYFPWCLEKVAAGKVIAVSTEEAPVEAARDQETWRHFGIESTLVFPLSVGGESPIGAISFNTVCEERTWPEPVVKQLQLLAQVFSNTIARKRADRALRENETRLSLATNAAGAGLWIMELDTGEVWVSEKSRDLFQFAPDERLTYESYFKKIHPEDREKVRQAVQQALQSGERLKTDYRIVLPDGSIRWIAARGQPYPTTKPTRLMGVALDITDRKQMEEQIELAGQEWQATFDSIPDVVMILDRDLRILRHNASAVSFFKLPPQGILGRHCHHLMHGANEPPPDCPARKSLTMKDHQEHEVYDEKRKAWFLVTSDPILGKEGQITKIVHRIKDITSKKRAEVEALAVRRELQRSERELRMGELAASLAHELNQPLTSILSNANAALRFIETDRLDLGEFKEILEDIANDDKRAGDIIRSVRSMFTQEDGEREPVAINSLLQEVVAFFKAEAITRKIQLDLDFADLLPGVAANKIQVQQVVLNLMMNAAESMPDTSQERRITIRTALSDKGRVQVAVADTGSGIEEKDLGRVFEPFFTRKRSGMGMGLSISRTIIEAHGGHIWVRNNPDKGATFFFDLPVTGDR